jgi:hypothetical protein
MNDDLRFHITKNFILIMLVAVAFDAWLVLYAVPWIVKRIERIP